MKDCVFCKIISGEINVEKIYEDESFVIIKDINPIAPIHLLMISKSHYAKLEEATIAETMELSFMLNKLAQMKSDLGLKNGYRLIINQGEDAGQTVQHLHIHILGGKKLSWGA
jgi:histidine triad (HIT) family protein